jgi:hypothetical protein
VSKELAVVVASVCLWYLLWIKPMLVFPFAMGAGIWLCGLIVAGAVRHRARGRYSGLFFAVLLLTIPGWVTALMRLYEQR